MDRFHKGVSRPSRLLASYGLLDEVAPRELGVGQRFAIPPWQCHREDIPRTKPLHGVQPQQSLARKQVAMRFYARHRRDQRKLILRGSQVFLTLTLSVVHLL